MSDIGPTIVDVLENALDGELTAARAERLTLPEVAALRESVLEFYDAWAPYPPEGDVLRVHLGGWIAALAAEGLARDLLHAALLYAHEVVVHDPVAAYFEPRRHNLRAFRPVVGRGLNLETSQVQIEKTSGYGYFGEEHLEAHRSHLAIAISRVGALAPLIRAGVVVPIPHLRLTLQRQERIWTAIRLLLQDDEYLRIVDHPVDRPPLSADDGIAVQFLTHPRSTADARIQQYGDGAYWFSRSIAMADASYATYMPPSATEWAIHQHRLTRLRQEISRRGQVELTLAPALLGSPLPYFRGLSSADVLAARRDEEGFEQWRTRLRKAARQISALPSEGVDFAEEARDVLQAELGETAAEVRSAVSRSAALKRNLRPAGITLTTGAAAIGGAQVISSSPASAAFGGLALTGMLRWLADSVLPQSLSGTKAVMAHLVHDASAPADDWPKRDPLLITPKQRGS